MGTIILSAEVETLLKKIMEEDETKINHYRKTKHKKPSYNETLLYILKRQKTILFCLDKFRKIEGKNKEEHEQIEYLLKKIDECMD
jgi:hypothetical protein